MSPKERKACEEACTELGQLALRRHLLRCVRRDGRVTNVDRMTAFGIGLGAAVRAEKELRVGAWSEEPSPWLAMLPKVPQ